MWPQWDFDQFDHTLAVCGCCWCCFSCWRCFVVLVVQHPQVEIDVTMAAKEDLSLRESQAAVILPLVIDMIRAPYQDPD